MPGSRATFTTFMDFECPHHGVHQLLAANDESWRSVRQKGTHAASPNFEPVMIPVTCSRRWRAKWLPEPSTDASPTTILPTKCGIRKTAMTGPSCVQACATGAWCVVAFPIWRETLPAVRRAQAVALQWHAERLVAHLGEFRIVAVCEDTARVSSQLLRQPHSVCAARGARWRGSLTVAKASLEWVALFHD